MVFNMAMRLKKEGADVQLCVAGDFASVTGHAGLSPLMDILAYTVPNELLPHQLCCCPSRWVRQAMHQLEDLPE